MLDRWPSIVRPLVQKYSEKRVQAVGLKTLQYPPMWIHTYSEANAVREALAATR